MSEAPPPFVVEGTSSSPPREDDAAGDGDIASLNNNYQRRQQDPRRAAAVEDRRANNMETLLRQWEAEGVASRNNGSSRLLLVDNNDDGGGGGAGIGDDVMNSMYSLRIDRSASLDDELIAAAHTNFAALMNNNNNNNATTTTAERVERSDSIGSSSIGGNNHHRRINSAGGSRSLPFEELAQLYDEMPLLDVAALHDAARITDWPTVLSLSTSHPESAKYVGKDGWNALHHACDRRCPHVDVMESLLTAYPNALVQTNDKGWTPLHRACRNKTPKDVVRLLLQKYSHLGKRAATMRCNDGRSSLHYALLYDAPEGVVDLLLRADPGAVLDEDRDGVTPLGTVWDKYANSFEGKRMLQILRPFEGEGWVDGEGQGRGGGNNSEEAELVERTAKKAAETRVRNVMDCDQPSFRQLQFSWKTANLLLRAYFRFPLQEENILDNDATTTTTTPCRKWRVFHATCAIKCHPKLILMARALHPEQAMEVDMNDLFREADHDVAIPDLQSTQFPVSRKTALHFAAMSSLSGREGRNVIKLVLKLNPNAALFVDGHGNLPLHLICQNSHKMQWISCGPKDIFEAYPEASVIGDSNGKTPLHCIASSFWCVRSRPARLPTLLTAQTVRPGVIQLNMPPVLNESVIQNLVEANAIAASIPDDSGRLSLHYIAIHAEEWTADITSILTAHPIAAQTRAGPSTHSQLPLHMAASSPFARPSLIKNLVIANPRASSIMDERGQLPLHLAVDSGRIMWDEGIQAIYEAYTPAISTPEESPRRWTVLHVAAASASAGRDLIEYIIAQHENSASIPDGDGKYPLHLACATNKSWVEGGIKAIFDADPSVGLSEDSNHLLPFHIAALTGCMLTNTSISKNLSADSIDNRIDTQDETTNSVAARGDTFSDDLKSLEVLFNLLTAQPSIVHL